VRVVAQPSTAPRTQNGWPERMPGMGEPTGWRMEGAGQAQLSVDLYLPLWESSWTWKAPPFAPASLHQANCGAGSSLDQVLCMPASHMYMATNDHKHALIKAESSGIILEKLNYMFACSTVDPAIPSIWGGSQQSKGGVEDNGAKRSATRMSTVWCTLGTIDHSLRLPKCSRHTTNANLQNSLFLRCGEAGGCSIFVP
jgi:hypothetical protein